MRAGASTRGCSRGTPNGNSGSRTSVRATRASRSTSASRFVTATSRPLVARGEP